MDTGDYYFWQTAVRAGLCTWLAYLLCRPSAVLAIKALGGMFAFLAFSRGIFLYRAGIGLQQTDSLMLIATTLETAALAAVAFLLWRRQI